MGPPYRAPPLPVANANRFKRSKGRKRIVPALRALESALFASLEWTCYFTARSGGVKVERGPSGPYAQAHIVRKHMAVQSVRGKRLVIRSNMKHEESAETRVLTRMKATRDDLAERRPSASPRARSHTFCARLVPFCLLSSPFTGLLTCKSPP